MTCRRSGLRTATSASTGPNPWSDNAGKAIDFSMKTHVRTVTREALVIDGSDGLFRELINNLLLFSKQLQALRAEIAEQLNVSEPQYRVFTTVLLLQGETGVSVGAVANALHVTGAFATAEAGKLVRVGLLEKAADETDRRSVLLSVSAKGRARFEGFATTLQTVNDELFHDFTRE